MGKWYENPGRVDTYTCPKCNGVDGYIAQDGYRRMVCRSCDVVMAHHINTEFLRYQARMKAMGYVIYTIVITPIVFVVVKYLVDYLME